MHQINVPSREAGSGDHVQRAACLAAGVDPPQDMERAVIKALHANTESVHASRPVLGEATALGATGVTFQRDLDMAG